MIPWLTAGHDIAATIALFLERKTLNSPLAMQTEIYLSSLQLVLVEQLNWDSSHRNNLHHSTNQLYMDGGLTLVHVFPGCG